MTDRQRNGLILLLVAGLIAASAVVIATKKTVLGLDLKGGVELVYQGEPTAQTPKVTQTALSRAVDVMRNRVDQLGVTEPTIQTQAPDLIDVQLPNVTNVAQAEKEVGNTARLEFYDWEANALVPTGPHGTAQTVASQLQAQNQQALAVSQGSTSGSIPPGSGSSTAGAMGLYQAVKFASQQPESSSPDNARAGPEYYLFGAPGSQLCQQYASSTGTKLVPGAHCLVAGPLDPGPYVSHANALAQLYQGLPNSVVALAHSQGQVQVIKQGTVVLQAVPPKFPGPKFGSPTAGYYVLKDHVALFGNQISNPVESTDSTGAPDVQFGFQGNGGNAFQSVTATIARRGELNSIGSQRLFQHFATALDNQLVTVPQIDYTQYPDGITGGQGADITGGFTANTANQLASELRLGALPIKLKQISESQVSATLGQQALHQGLLAGLIGLIVVAIFLLAFYRVLGVIAIGGLIAYGIYFYALIKLIPITMTLAGIAGLILTIGVAADANIVIFERVKEEIRGGRSVRQGIITGYRKGLTAIIDANVVTIMTAFILFVLATADVKGFAFTLGIGTFVSLFTAVMATRAILMTMGNSRALRSPSALGAGKPKRAWRFDFMGASRYFFTMSGVILLVGALAVGGRGLHLGIDFTSGTQISVGLNHPANVSQVRSVMAKAGDGNAQIQQVHNSKTLGPYAFQIDSRYLTHSRYQAVRNDLNAQFGGIRTNAAGSQDFNTTSVGPTFGASIAHSAVIAIIASLLVITVYVALRFEWKFTVPVLIALAHDLLITSGVYALTGRVVTVDTVAALLTILGYSLYDTIIVFDRVRENIPRMPRAAFSQIVNRSMSEVLTRSLATTSCTLLPIIALLLFGGSTLKDFAFALLIGVASGAYSSIFIASPVLTHWKEREHGFRARRHRLEADYGSVPAYAAAGADVEPARDKARRAGRLTQPDPENVSSTEFEQMKRDLGLEVEEQRTTRRPTSTLSKRTAHTEPEVQAATRRSAAAPTAPATPPPPEPSGNGDDFTPAPDIAENEGVAPIPKGERKPAKPRPRNRRHGRKR
ncbi:MAG TPA: protein translocase subunit SecD [Solirubrobacteraceae bacterium]|jgi:SecD/SecF fusion protein|nr:protein translocase subunit SecD [Solirubrobacteraceae bacterium]